MKSSQSSNNRLQLLIAGFLYGDIGWAHVRAALFILVVDLIAIAMAVTFEETTPILIWHSLVFPSCLLAGVLWICSLIARDIYETDRSDSKIGLFVLELVAFVGLSVWGEFKFVEIVGLTGLFVGHYLLAPLIVVVGTIMAASRYVQDIYGLESYGLSLLYTVTSFWGIAYPELVISEGEKHIEVDKVNRLDLIGGPGYITVPPGNAVLVQEQNNSSKVFSAQRFFVSRYGYIVSIVNLEDQHGSVSSVSATTKDGIKITVRDIELRYRIWPGHSVVNSISVGRSHVNPYPFTAQAVRDSTYNRSVANNGLTPWFDMVKGVVVGKITDYITAHQFDQIVTPNYEQGDPRKQIRDQLFTSETQNKLKDMGAHLLWCDIGHFEEDRAALEQRLETWSARWTGNANVIRAQGEAQRVAYQELGHAEAQADMLRSIIHAFDDIDLSKEKKDQNIRNVILMRTAQILDSLTDTQKPLDIGKKSPFALPGDITNREDKQS